MNAISRLLLVSLLGASSLCFASSANSKEPKWVRLNSAHFSILTDENDLKARATAVARIEQMRDIFLQLFAKTKLRLSEPLDVIAFRSDEEYIRAAPLRQGRPISAPGFFLAGEDRNYIVLDLAAEDSWRAVSYDFARLFLSFNYPPTQDWFDEGFAQYFSSLRLADNHAEIGGDPTQNLPWEHALAGQAAGSKAPQSFVDLLNGTWMPLPELFKVRKGASGYQPMFRAQSWMVMHYLLNQNKLSEAGTYFGLVEVQKVPVEEAIQQAFGVSAAQLEQTIRDYFRALSWSRAAGSKIGNAPSASDPIHPFPAVLEAGQVGSSVLDIPDVQARSLVGETVLRLPEHREQGEKDLQAINDDPKMENAIAHRGLAWAHLQRNEFDQANEELARASELDGRDPWVHYYLALVKFQAAKISGHSIQGVSNMIQDLLAVIDWNLDFAEAYNMLAMGRLDGGGVHAATDTIKMAIQLNPRSQQYLLNLAQIELAGKKWDDATALLERLKSSLDRQIAQTAQRSLDDLPTLKKYGVLPERDQTAAPAAAKAVPKAPAATTAAKTNSDSVSDSDSDNSSAAPPEPVLDKRKVLFLKGKLISVDCTQGTGATVTVRAAAKTYKLRTDNYKALLLVGADEFSCLWTDRPVVANYKAGGKADGDLVSLEVQ